MIDLFRYVEHSFVVPPAQLDVIDADDSSEFQSQLRLELKDPKQGFAELRGSAEAFITKHPLTGEVQSTVTRYLELHAELLRLATGEESDVNEAIERLFDTSAEAIKSSDEFKKDRRFLNDLLVAVKIATGFDKVRAADLVAMRQALAFIETFSARRAPPKDLKAALLRPIVIPSAYLKPRAKPVTVPPSGNEPSDQHEREALTKELESLKSAYTTLMTLRPDELHMKETQPPPEAASPKAAIPEPETPEPATRAHTTKFARSPVPTARSALALKEAAIRKLEPPALALFKRESLDLATTDVTDLVKAVSAKTKQLGLKINPCGKVQLQTKVYRLGLNAFAIKPAPPAPAPPSPATPPDFSSAVTRPVGIGNLRVVRQELLGYEAKEVSHIENVLKGEVLRRSTIRSEQRELTITDATLTVQTEERDLQTTIRNELASEAQKESGQSASSQGQSSTSSYGKLVENDKSSYAKTITDRAVSSLSQQVAHQRTQRETKSYTEKASHDFDNSHSGASNVVGIYQWVDRKYKTRVMSYGTRLLYDVVVPEPAAFLIEALKNAPQSEGLELVKPDVFDMCPACLDADNYACLAAKYGATGAVTPPPDDFLLTKELIDFSIDGPKKVEAFGNVANGFFFKAFKIQIPENYKAVRCYVQMVIPHLYEFEDIHLEFNIAKDYYQVFETPRRFKEFQMNEETGVLPVTFRSFGGIYQYAFGIGIECQRTDKALEQWQLKTHAAILSGYNRQLSEYQDKLVKFQAVVRSQLSRAANYAHNPTLECSELKKAFIYLLLAEHFGKAYVPTPNPTAIPTDPSYVKTWGAMVAFFERAFEWENMMYTYYPYFWGRTARWGELILIQDLSPEFEAFLKAGAARIVVPVRPGFEAALAHYQETGAIWLGEDIPDMFSPLYVSIIQELRARNLAPGEEICIEEWDVTLPTTLVLLKDDAVLPEWPPSVPIV